MSQKPERDKDAKKSARRDRSHFTKQPAEEAKTATKGKDIKLFILNAIILVVEGILSRSKPDSERQDTGAVKCVNRTMYAVFVDSEKAFWNHYGKFLCFSLSRQRLEERHKREKKGHDLNYKTPGLLSYPILTDINISIRRQSTSAQKLSKLTCRSIFKRNRSNI